MRIKCYGCGLEGDADLFVERGWQNQPTRGLTVRFWCPQCSCAQPKLAPASLWGDEKAPWPHPRWEVVETSQGICIRTHGGCIYTAPMVKGHQLEDAPASLLRPDLTGTIREHSAFLKLDGEARAASFKTDCDAWDAVNPPPADRVSHAYVDWREARLAHTDKVRAENGVGPHYQEVVHDGPTLMRKTRTARRAA